MERNITVADLRGQWISDRFSTQLGEATNQICFDADGNFSSRFVSKGMKSQSHGTYSITGDRLALRSSEQTSVQRILDLRDDRLILDENGRPVRYRRRARNCYVASNRMRALIMLEPPRTILPAYLSAAKAKAMQHHIAQLARLRRLA